MAKLTKAIKKYFVDQQLEIEISKFESPTKEGRQENGGAGGV